MGLQYELHFEPLRDGGRSYAFPCDGNGHVDMDTMTPRARNDYLFARACMGLEFSRPLIRNADSRLAPVSPRQHWDFRTSETFNESDAERSGQQKHVRNWPSLRGNSRDGRLY